MLGISMQSVFFSFHSDREVSFRLVSQFVKSALTIEVNGALQQENVKMQYTLLWKYNKTYIIHLVSVWDKCCIMLVTNIMFGFMLINLVCAKFI